MICTAPFRSSAWRVRHHTGAVDRRQRHKLKEGNRRKKKKGMATEIEEKKKEEKGEGGGKEDGDKMGQG